MVYKIYYDCDGVKYSNADATYIDDLKETLKKSLLEIAVYKKAIIKYSEKCDRLKYLEERIKIFNEISKQTLIDHPHYRNDSKTYPVYYQLTFFYPENDASSSDDESTSE